MSRCVTIVCEGEKFLLCLLVGLRLGNTVLHLKMPWILGRTRTDHASI